MVDLTGGKFRLCHTLPLGCELGGAVGTELRSLLSHRSKPCPARFFALCDPGQVRCLPSLAYSSRSGGRDLRSTGLIFSGKQLEDGRTLSVCKIVRVVVLLCLSHACHITAGTSQVAPSCCSSRRRIPGGPAFEGLLLSGTESPDVIISIRFPKA